MSRRTVTPPLEREHPGGMFYDFRLCDDILLTMEELVRKLPYRDDRNVLEILIHRSKRFMWWVGWIGENTTAPRVMIAAEHPAVAMSARRHLEEVYVVSKVEYGLPVKPGASLLFVYITGRKASA